MSSAGKQRSDSSALQVSLRPAVTLSLYLIVLLIHLEPQTISQGIDEMLKYDLIPKNRTHPSGDD